MTMDKDEAATSQPMSEEKNGAKKPWITPELEEYDPNIVTRSGFVFGGTDSGIYS
jgi:hypothetical protein